VYENKKLTTGTITTPILITLFSSILLGGLALFRIQIIKLITGLI
jgi:hypothetical protein